VEKFPALVKEGTDLRRVQQANQGWLGNLGSFDHPCVVRLTRHDAVPFRMAGTGNLTGFADKIRIL